MKSLKQVSIKKPLRKSIPLLLSLKIDPHFGGCDLIILIKRKAGHPYHQLSQDERNSFTPETHPLNSAQLNSTQRISHSNLTTGSFTYLLPQKIFGLTKNPAISKCVQHI